MTEYEDYYQIYSDVVFNKSDIIEALKQPVSLSQRMGQKLDQRSWRLAVDLSGVGTFDHDLRSAMAGWNNVNSSIDFRERTYNTQRYYIKVFIGQDGGQPDKLCHVVPNPNPESPAYYLKFADIYINTAHKDWTEKVKNLNKIVQLFQHALGHVIKLDHVEANVDQNSIMRSEEDFLKDPWAWHLISNEDARKLKEAYPHKDAPEINYILDSQPIQIGSDRKVKLNVGQQYQFKLDYYYDWNVISSYNYWTSTGSDVVTHSRDERILILKFNKAGQANFDVTVQDELLENTYQDKIIFYAESNIPKFFPPTPASLKVGEFAQFNILFNPDEYKNVTYSMTAYEELFDKSDRNVEVVRSGGTFNVKLKDYGRYRFTFKVTYDNHTSTFNYRVARLARPAIFGGGEGYLVTIPNPYQLPSEKNPPRVPTGENKLYEHHTDIKFGLSDLMQKRIVYDLTYYHERMIMHLPGRPDKHVFLDKVVENQILRAGESSLIDHVRYGMYHPDSINYQYHYTVLYPTLTLVNYPSDYDEKTGEDHT